MTRLDQLWEEHAAIGDELSRLESEAHCARLDPTSEVYLILQKRRRALRPVPRLTTEELTVLDAKIARTRLVLLEKASEVMLERYGYIYEWHERDLEVARQSLAELTCVFVES